MADVLYEVRNSVARITINRPDRRNAMSAGVLDGLNESLDTASRDQSVRVVVIAGAGDRAFSAGADLGGMAPETSMINAHDARGLIAAIFRKLWKLNKPSVASVRGFALAGGFGLALACDFVVAASDAQFGTPEINVGLWPYMITVPLLRSMPPRYALELMATGRRVQADEAQRIGFVNRVVAVDELDSTVNELATTLASKSPLIMRLGRQSFYRVLGMDADAALDYLQSMLTLTVSSDDTAEGLAAFADGRQPEWRGS
ncbi:MAG TPA: enoyl-CoA hydratase-related protein [Acidimicrobiia bacterium]|jgi:enoyl-CoA hydratase/carnithine racemase|nr:enoyl-CoA hydratase-related protein [Acidimicrobiia bacterium]